MPPDSATLLAWRDRVAALRAPACDMAHEAIPRQPDGTPRPSTTSPSGYSRIGICAPSVRERHIGCSHTTARLVLGDALLALGDDDAPLVAALRDLENAISLLDHRRYDAETGYARAVDAGADMAATRAAIDSLVAEHRACAARAAALRDAVLARLDAALAGQPAAPIETYPRGL
jgi:hypothetical protein